MGSLMAGACTYERVVALVRANYAVVPAQLPRAIRSTLDFLAEAYPSRDAAWQAIAKAIDALEGLRGTADPIAVESAFDGWCRVITDVVKYHPDRIQGPFIHERKAYADKLAAAFKLIEDALNAPSHIPDFSDHFRALQALRAALFSARPRQRNEQRPGRRSARPDYAAVAYLGMLGDRPRKYAHVIPAIWTLVNTLVRLCKRDDVRKRKPFPIGAQLLNLAKVEPIKGSSWTESAVRNLYYKHRAADDAFQEAEAVRDAIAEETANPSVKTPPVSWPPPSKRRPPR